MSDKNERLTNEQKELVAENHNLIYGYAYKNGVLLDDYYDVLAIGLCKAAKHYDSSKGKFSTFAFKCMNNEMNMMFNNLYKKSIIPDAMVSSYGSLPYGDDFTETIQDSKSCNDIEYNTMVNEILSLLTKKESVIFKYLLNDLTHNEIANILKCNRQNITYSINKIRKKVSKYLL